MIVVSVMSVVVFYLVSDVKTRNPHHLFGVGFFMH